jgi:hypothetical protein
MNLAILSFIFIYYLIGLEMSYQKNKTLIGNEFQNLALRPIIYPLVGFYEILSISHKNITILYRSKAWRIKEWYIRTRDLKTNTISKYKRSN